MNGRQVAEVLRRLGAAAGFPLRYRDKRPAIRDWERAAISDPVQLAASWPCGANLGIPCGPAGLAVLDVDPGGAEALDWLADGRPVPATYAVGTPRPGGRHLYFRQLLGRPVRNSAGKLCPGVDVRGAGGYVVGAGSVVDGRAYSGSVALDHGGRYVLLDDRTPAPLPGWLADLLLAPRRGDAQSRAARPVVHHGGYGAAALAGEAQAVAGSRPGERNHRLNEAAFRLGQLVPDGMLTVENITTALMSAAADCGLMAEDGPARCERTIRGGIAAGAASPRRQAVA